jgi:hypothetical protein
MLENTQETLSQIVAENKKKTRVDMPFGFGKKDKYRLTFDEAMALPELDFTPEKVPYIINGRESETAFAIYRRDTDTELGTVGAGYASPQPHVVKDAKGIYHECPGVNHKNALRAVESLLTHDGCYISNVQVLEGGAIVRLLVRVPQADFNVLGDVTEAYVMQTHYYNSVSVGATSLLAHQPICTNGMHAWLAEATMKHRKTSRAGLHQAHVKTLLEQSILQFGAIGETMKKLANYKLTNALFEEFVQVLVPSAEKLKEETKNGQKRQNAAVEYLSNQFDMPNVPELLHTAKGALDAVTNMVTHRKTATGLPYYDAQSQIMGTGAKLSETAEKWLLKNLYRMPEKRHAQTFAMPANIEATRETSSRR